MKTPWGELPVADAHVHFFSRRFFASIAGDRPIEALGTTLGWEMPPDSAEELAERWVRELDRHGVDRAVLIASVHGDEDSVIEAVTRYPQRFFGYFMVNPLATDGIQRAERALASHRLRGICLFPAMHRYSLHDPLTRAVFELAAAERGTVVFVHCGVLTVGVRKKLGLPSHFDMRFSNPIDVHALALEFPGVAFIIPHFGAGYFREALMLADLCPNVYLDTSSSNSWIKYEPEALDLRRVFARTLEVLGAKRLLFGSDSSFFPRGWNGEIFDTQARVLKEIGISEDEARSIFGGNLERLLLNR
jgi:predicted TIM-barrel fold metal-dependent hydrolase